jgi:hypothetical protein
LTLTNDGGRLADSGRVSWQESNRRPLIGTLPAVEIRPEILALVLAYIAGGTIMNILRHELPDTDRSSDVVAFATAATVFGALLLSLSAGG